MLVNFEDPFYLTDLVPNVVSLPQEEKLSGRIAGMTADIRCWTPGVGCPYWGPMSHRRVVGWSRNSKARPWESFYCPSVTVSPSASQHQGGLCSPPPAIKMMDGHFNLHQMFSSCMGLKTRTFICVNTSLIVCLSR